MVGNFFLQRVSLLKCSSLAADFIDDCQEPFDGGNLEVIPPPPAGQLRVPGYAGESLVNDVNNARVNDPD